MEQMSKIIEFFLGYLKSINGMLKALEDGDIDEDVLTQFTSYLYGIRQMKKKHKFMSQYSSDLDSEIIDLTVELKEYLMNLGEIESQDDIDELADLLFDLKDCVVEYMKDIAQIVDKQKKIWKKKHPFLFRGL